jgi:glycosyltransferase involved in cell wall biosynthesis
MRGRALIATIPPISGGVPAMLRVMIRLLDEEGIDSEVAWYEPWSLTPRLSVPFWRLGTRRVGADPRRVSRETDGSGGEVSGYAIGAYLPELEFTHYAPTRPWRERIAASDLHLVVSGTALAGRAFAETGTAFLAWIASDWAGDRRDRARRFPASRRLVDRFVVRRVARRLEAGILRRGRIVALSAPTATALDAAAGRSVTSAVLPQPIESEKFRPRPDAVVPGRVGFVGRIDDPRKNLLLFLDALTVARNAGADVAGEIIGGAPSDVHRSLVAERGLDSSVEFVPHLPPEELPERLSRLDLLAVTSHQEGLCIAALESMAAGCPVVSTRCGGPEEYIRDGESGFLTSRAPAEIAGRWLGIIRDRPLRARLSHRARQVVLERYSWDRVRSGFRQELGRFRLRGAR